MKHPYRFASVLIAILLPVHIVVPRDFSISLSAIILSGIAGAYIGFAARDGRPSAFLIEGAGAAIFIAAAFAGLSGFALAIPLGLFAHAGWDLLHHRGTFGAKVPSWYIPFCVAIDVAVGAGLLVLYWGMPN